MSEGKAALLTLFVFTVVAIVVGVSRFLSNQRRQQKEARFEKLKQEAIRFFDQVTSTGKLPSPQTHVILRSGELMTLVK